MNWKFNLHHIPILPLVMVLGITIALFDCDTLFATPSVANTKELSLEDKERVLRLLRTRQFQQLETYYINLQEQYEIQNSLNDWQLFIQYQPFYDTDPAIETLLTEWISQFPESYPARLARGIYYRKLGEQKRGGKWANQTPRENFEQLSKYLDLATVDLLASRPLIKKPIVSVVHLMNITKHRDGDLGNRYWLEEANRIDSLNYGARRRYMLTLTPRWGGSYEDMYSFLQECRSQNLPAEYIRIFEALIHEDRATIYRHNRKSAEAYTHYRHALMLLNGIENEETIKSLEGLIYSARESNALDRVAEEIDQYLRIGPQDLKILGYRGWLREKTGRVVEAMADFKEAAMKGDAWSQFRIAWHLLHDTSPTVEEKRKEGLAWLKQSAQQGYEPAQRLLQQVE